MIGTGSTRRIRTRCTATMGLALLMAGVLGGCGAAGTGGSPDAVDAEPPGGARTSVTLTWDPPTTRVDGTPLTGLAGFRIYYSRGSAAFTTTLDVGNVAGATIAGLEPGTYYFAVAARDDEGREGLLSNVVQADLP